MGARQIEEDVDLDIIEKFDEFRKSLNKLVDDIAGCQNADITDSTFQLKKINATINELKKNSITVPDELTKLKLSLSSQIDEVKDHEKIRQELIKCLQSSILQLERCAPEKPAKKERTKKITVQERVNLIDLIDASIIPPGTELYAYYKNSRISSTLLSDGSLEMTLKKRKKNFDSHRAAAIAITGYQVDAWKFWRLDFEGKPLTLDDYRQKYFKRKKKENAETTT